MTNPSTTNPTIDTSNVTVAAFNAIKKQEKKAKTDYLLGRDDVYENHKYKSPNFKAKVKAWTKDDNQYHTYFHSLSIDVNVEDFMGTAELKCPYDSKLMEYWEPIRQTVVIYGTNRGKDDKILFIGRVRGVKQDGYELVIEFQNYAWKFKQLVTQSYANDFVLKKDGYTILRLMFEALKIDSYVISEAAKRRLKQVGINEDGNLTLNGKEVEKMPDLLKRLKASNPAKLVNKYTINQKLQEQYLHNIDHINYTLKYEKPTKIMKKIASEGSYSGGSNVYSNPYGSASGVSAGGASATGRSEEEQQVRAANGGCDPRGIIEKQCPEIESTSMISHMKNVWKYQRNCQNDLSYVVTKVKEYAGGKYGHTGYYLQVRPCLQRMEKYTERSGGKQTANGATYVRNQADSVYSSNTIKIGTGAGASATKTNKSSSSSSSQSKKTSVSFFGWKIL